MCFVITATPAHFHSSARCAVMEMQVLDPNRIMVQHQASTVPTVRDAHDFFRLACDSLDPHQSYLVSAHWHGRTKPPRGFKAAYDRGEFMRRLNRNQNPAQQAA